MAFSWYKRARRKKRFGRLSARRRLLKKRIIRRGRKLMRIGYRM